MCFFDFSYIFFRKCAPEYCFYRESFYWDVTQFSCGNFCAFGGVEFGSMDCNVCVIHGKFYLWLYFVLLRVFIFYAGVRMRFGCCS